jgi:hypothetical protein
MSRVIKFRAWDKTLPGECIYTQHEDGPNVTFWGEVWAHPDEYIVEQYTGLLDKNGREIYEGDILRDVDGMDRDGAVYWSAYGAWHVRNYMPYMLSNVIASLEVIGNIHENPELLNVPST